MHCHNQLGQIRLYTKPCILDLPYWTVQESRKPSRLPSESFWSLFVERESRQTEFSPSTQAGGCLSGTWGKGHWAEPWALRVRSKCASVSSFLHGVLKLSCQETVVEHRKHEAFAKSPLGTGNPELGSRDQKRNHDCDHRSNHGDREISVVDSINNDNCVPAEHLPYQRLESGAKNAT